MSRRASLRLEAVVQGRAGTRRAIGPDEAHARNVLAITKRIHTKQARLRAALAEAARLRGELRQDKRELRAVLQRDSRVTLEQLEVAGQADATDRAMAHAEERRDVAPFADRPASPARDAALEKWRQS